MGHFSPKSPIISDSFAKRGLQLKASYASSLSCSKGTHVCCGADWYACLCAVVMYMYMYIYIYINLHSYMYIYIYVFVCMCLSVLCVLLHVCVCNK